MRPRSATFTVVLAASGCVLPSGGIEPDSVWSVDRITALVGVDPGTGDAFALHYEITDADDAVAHAPVLARLASADGEPRWSVELPDAMIDAGDPATALAGDALVVISRAATPYVIGDVAIPAQPTLLWFATETGALVATTPAPPTWGAPAFLDNFVGRTDGTVAGAFSGEDSNVAPVTLMDRSGVRWSTSLVPPSVVWALSVGPDGREVVAATDAGAYRIDGDDGTARQLPPVSLITPITYGAAIAGDGASYAIDIASWEVRARRGNGDAWWTARLGDRIDPRGLDIAPDGRLLVRGWYSTRTADTPRTTVSVLDRTTGAIQKTVEFEPSAPTPTWNVGRIVGGRDGRVYVGGMRLRVVQMP